MNSTCRARSTDPLAALRRYLAALASDTVAESIVVADEDGLVIGGYGAIEQQLALAAWCAVPLPARRTARRLLDDVGVCGPLHITPVACAGATLNLASYGGAAPPVAETERVLNQILG